MVTGLIFALLGDNLSGKEAVIPFEKMGKSQSMAGGTPHPKKYNGQD